MATIDFNDWMDNNVENIEDAYCLSQCILNNENIGSYDITSKGVTKFIKAHAETLMLVSVNAQKTFLRMLESRFAYEGLDIESSYEFHRQMEKND